MTCKPCMNAAEGLRERIAASAFAIMPIYRALHQRHRVGRIEGLDFDPTGRLVR